ncbi:MAG: sodium:calcium antiporter, partial [Desulfobacterales bacterium]|nr:sodium:calcium antiporter [Desulfobacterales bacterium]
LIISLGTSLPEMISSIFAVIKGSPTIVAGSVVGSNVTNTFLVLGVAFLFFKEKYVKIDLIDIDLPFLLTATLLFVFMCYDGDYSWADGVFSLFGAALYIVSTLKRNPEGAEESKGDGESKEEGEDEVIKVTPLTYGLLIVSAVMLYFGGEWTVEYINKAAEIFKINQGVVAGTAVALAASLPELLISARFAAKGKLDVALGNVVGAGIFNCLVVMGLSSFFGPSGHLKVAPETITHGLPMMLAAVIVFIFVTIDKRPSKVEGGLFLMFYVYYLGDLIGWL